VLGRVNNARFLIVGDGPQRGALERCANELGIGEAIHWTGFRRDMPEILRAMDVCCLSSRPRQETFSVAALEAMASGLPVVSTRVGFMHEMVLEGTTGFIVPVDDQQALAEAISGLALNPEKRNRMGDSARALVEESFSLQHMIASFEDLFSRCAHRCGRTGNPCAQ
jgi:glycosyltransferase involved in cell wall biosynthesis